MANNFGLLLDPVIGQFPARLQRIIIAAKRMPTQHEMPSTVLLNLPDMRHLVDEKPLERESL